MIDGQATGAAPRANVFRGKRSRIFELWIARQKTGKTTALRSRVRALYHDRGIRSTWVLDTLGEWPGALDLVDVTAVTPESYDQVTAAGLPRVMIWRVDPDDHDTLEWIWQEAIAQGDVALVLDEGYLYAPGPHWRASVLLKRIVLQGRHLPDMRRELRPTHLIISAQYPRTLHLLVWSQADTILVGQIEGRATLQWCADNFAEPAQLETIRELRPFQWIALRGSRPPMPGYGPDG